jgi:hypothetical protein
LYAACFITWDTGFVFIVTISLAVRTSCFQSEKESFLSMDVFGMVTIVREGGVNRKQIRLTGSIRLAGIDPEIQFTLQG